jgi:uncharacterized phiE125 gp8 family phage protein
MMRLTRLTEPTTEPLTLDQVKEHLRVDIDAEDSLIQDLIGSARDYCERYCNRAWAASEWRAEYLTLPTGKNPFCLNDPGISAITSIKYIDSNGDAQTVSDSNYSFDVTRSAIYPSTDWPTGSSSVIIDYESGPDHSASPSPIIPKSVLAGMKLVITDLFENRSAMITGTIVSKNPAADSLLHPYRVDIGI